MENKFSNFISYVFHPLFMPTLGLLFFYYSNDLMLFNNLRTGEWFADNTIIIAVTIVFSLIIPVFGVAVLKKKGRVSSFRMPTKEERLMPFGITLISIFSAYYLLFQILNIETDVVIKVFFWGCILSIMGALTLTLFWKVSVHMIGIGGFTGALFLMSKLYGEEYLLALSAAVIISGLVAYSRLRLKAHSSFQLIAGFAVGFFSETFCLLVI